MALKSKKKLKKKSKRFSPKWLFLLLLPVGLLFTLNALTQKQSVKQYAQAVPSPFCLGSCPTQEELYQQAPCGESGGGGKSGGSWGGGSGGQGGSWSKGGQSGSGGNSWWSGNKGSKGGSSGSWGGSQGNQSSEKQSFWQKVQSFFASWGKGGSQNQGGGSGNSWWSGNKGSWGGGSGGQGGSWSKGGQSGSGGSWGGSKTPCPSGQPGSGSGGGTAPTPVPGTGGTGSTPSQAPSSVPTTKPTTAICGQKSTPTTSTISCSGQTATQIPSSGYYTPTYFGCSAGYKDPGDNCIPACGSIPGCSGLSGQACEEKVKWFAANADQYGCNAVLKVTNPSTGKAVIVRAIDKGPHCSVQTAGPKFDLSKAAYDEIGAGSKVKVEKVANNTPLGPIPACP